MGVGLCDAGWSGVKWSGRGCGSGCFFRHERRFIMIVLYMYLTYIGAGSGGGGGGGGISISIILVLCIVTCCYT